MECKENIRIYHTVKAACLAILQNKILFGSWVQACCLKKRLKQDIGALQIIAVQIEPQGMALLDATD